jgi:hypothetical protein
LPDAYVSQAFVLDPQHPGTVFLGVGHDTNTVKTAPVLWKTTDCGASWTHVNTGAHGADLDSAYLWTLVLDPAHPDVLYTASGYGPNGVYKSTNGGVDWAQILPDAIAQVLIYGGFIERITMDPTDGQHLIVSPHFNCQNGHTNCIVETKDGGSTWRVIAGTPDSGEASGEIMLDAKTWLWANGSGLWRTADGGGSWTKAWDGGTFDAFYRSEAGTYSLMSIGAGVLQSADTLTWTPIPGSPHGRGLVGDGTTLFASNRNIASTPYEPYSSAPEGAPATWATYPSPPVSQGGWLIQYDADHHVLYSSSEHAGFWRVVTK